MINIKKLFLNYITLATLINHSFFLIYFSCPYIGTYTQSSVMMSPLPTSFWSHRVCQVMPLYILVLYVYGFLLVLFEKTPVYLTRMCPGINSFD